MPPHKAHGAARSRNTIDVAVKQVVSVRDDGEVLMARLDVGRASHHIRVDVGLVVRVELWAVSSYSRVGLCATTKPCRRIDSGRSWKRSANPCASNLFCRPFTGSFEMRGIVRPKTPNRPQAFDAWLLLFSNCRSWVRKQAKVFEARLYVLKRVIPQPPQIQGVPVGATPLMALLTFRAMNWFRLSEQNFRVDKWGLCRG
jgi:hypothetical protein